jgi:hypothetical protein
VLIDAANAAKHSLTRRYNVRHRQTLTDYLHLNPVRAGLVRPEAGESVLDYPWSSLGDGERQPADAATGQEARVGQGAGSVERLFGTDGWKGP